MEQNEFQNCTNRSFIGKLSGIVGIILNLFLAFGKIIVGKVAISMSITADGLNNLSDAISSVVTFIGFKLAEKPADREHPYGHARFEYLAGLTVSAMILVIGFELAKSSVEKIINPTCIEFSKLTAIALSVSIAVKLSMSIFYSKMGRKINSTVLFAAAQDSRNDTFTTTVILIGAFIEYFFKIQIDGFMGIIVSLFILYGGLELAKKTVSPLIGEGTNPILREQLTDYIMQNHNILGCHDLMVHDYGPGRIYASIHVEMDENENVVESHEIIDAIERACLDKFGIHLVIHYDPIDTQDFELNKMRNFISVILKITDKRMSVHDFRMNESESVTTLTFDVVIPSELQVKKESIKESLEEALNSISDSKYKTNITFDIYTNNN